MAVNIEDVFLPAKTFPSYGALVSVIVKNAIVLAGVISLVFLIIGGFGVIMSAGSGDTKKLEGGKKTITAAVMGIVIVITSVLMVQVIATLTGSDVLKQMIGMH